MGLVHTVEHTTNLFSVFVDSDSDPDSKILDSKMSRLDSRKKLLDWTHYTQPLDGRDSDWMSQVASISSIETFQSCENQLLIVVQIVLLNQF